MLQKLNERIQGFVAWIVIGLIAVTFALFGIDYYIQSHHDSSLELEVDGQPVTKQEFELSYRRTRQQRDPAQLTAATEKLLRKQVLEEITLNKVSTNAARQNGFEVNDAQADSAILGIPQFQQDGHFSAERYQHVLSNALFTHGSFLNEIRQGMLLNQQRFAFIGTAFALPTEIERFVKLYMQSRDFDYLVIPSAMFSNQVKVSDDEVNTYYKTHQKQFLSPEKVSIDYIPLSMVDIKSKISISDEQINHYYEENQANYLNPAQWQVAHIFFAIPQNAAPADEVAIKEKAEKTYALLTDKPQQFDEQVSALSDDKISKLNKGILPWIVAGQSELDKSLVNLTTPGEISKPIKTPHGYELFKLIAYKPAHVKLLADVKLDIQNQLIAENAQAEYAKIMEQLADLSYQTPDTLAPVAESLKVSVIQSPLFSRDGGNTDLLKNKHVIHAAFSHDVLELGNNSEPVQVDNDTVIVLRVNKHIPAEEKKLADVKTEIINSLTKEKIQAQAMQLGNQLLKATHEQDKLQKLVADNKLQWKNIKQSTRETDKTDRVINQQAFTIGHEGESAGIALPNGDYVVVRLNAINDGKLSSLDKEQIASITQQIEASFGEVDYDLYVHALMKNAKVIKH